MTAKPRVFALACAAALFAAALVPETARGAATASSPAEALVFGDTLGPGVEDWSWAVHNLHATEVLDSGVDADAAAIAFEPDGFRALQFHAAAPWAVGPTTTLELAIHGGTEGGQALRIVLSDGSDVRAAADLRELVGTTPAPGRWQTIRVPLAALGLRDGVVSDLCIQGWSEGDQPGAYVDEIRFLSVGSQGSPPAAPPAGSPPPSRDSAR